MARLLATVRRRVLRLLSRRGFDLDDDTLPCPDPVAEESPALADVTGASVQGRIALGPRAGARVLRLGREAGAPWVTSSTPPQAHLAGFDLHASLAFRATQREQVERLCCYLLRPPVAQERLQLTPEGHAAVELPTAWRDGTTHFLFSPVEVPREALRRHSPPAYKPRPLYYGILAPRSPWRTRVAAYGRAQQLSLSDVPGPEGQEPPCAATPTMLEASGSHSEPLGRDRAPLDPQRATAGAPVEVAPLSNSDPPPAMPSQRRRQWAALVRRAFDFEALGCPQCGGRMRLISTIEDPRAINKILTHLGLPTDVPEPLPARSPPAAPAGLFDQFGT